MKKFLFPLLLFLFTVIECSAQVSSDTLPTHKVIGRTAKMEMSVIANTQKHLSQAGDCFKMSGYLQYAAIGTGALAGVVAIISGNKEDGDAKDKLRLGAYALGGFAVAFELVSITYRVRGGKQLKLAANANGASVAINF